MGSINDVLRGAMGVITNMISVVVTLAFLFFTWGVVKYIWSAGNEDKKAEGKRIMVWGIIALFVITSIVGIITFVSGAFNI